MLPIHKICQVAPVIPVITIERITDAVPIAKSLVAGGLSVLEVTLRTECALDAIREMRAAVPDAIVGAGTLREADDIGQCLDAGAQFGVSPGAPEALIEAAQRAQMPFLPGCATPTEAMTLADRGFEVVKLFPASIVGGTEMLRSLANTLSGLRFCPTGGISLGNASQYLRLGNVSAIGGSWVSPKTLIDAQDWSGIESLAREAVAQLTPLQVDK